MMASGGVFDICQTEISGLLEISQDTFRCQMQFCGLVAKLCDGAHSIDDVGSGSTCCIL